MIRRPKNNRLAALLATGAFLLAAFSRCASIMTPTGGPRDSLPPVIVRMDPDNFSTGVPTLGSRTKILIEFDEYVQLRDQQKEFYTSPQMRKKPTVTLRGRGVVVQLRDTLEPNTTYALDFGSSLRDNNEGNPLHSMRYVFSTGPEIDSMICSGYTADAYKADSVGRTFVWFYIADSLPPLEAGRPDSTMFLRKPHVIGRSQGNGIFIAQNLKPVPYRVYAFTDVNDNQLYEPSVDKAGFLDSLVDPSRLPDFTVRYDTARRYVTADPQLYLRMFTDRAFRRQNLAEKERPEQHKAILYFAAPHPRITGLSFDGLPEGAVIRDPRTEGRDTLTLWIDAPSESIPDSLRGRITYFRHDTLNRLVEATEPLVLPWRRIESKEEEKERERLERERRRAEEAGETWVAPRRKSKFRCSFADKGELNPERGLKMTFDYPLRSIDSTALTLLYALPDEKEPPRRPARFTLRRDTADLLAWYLHSDWKPGARYELFLPDDAFEDIADQRNDSLRHKFTAAAPENYATLLVRIAAPDSLRYVVQLLDGSNRLLEEKRDVTAGEVGFNYVPAGEIRLRVVEDRNGNGRWDSGSVVERRQPERTEFYVNEKGESTFAAKANWEIEFDIDMERLFAPVTPESLARMLREAEIQRAEKERERRRTERRKESDRHGSSGGTGFGGFGGGGMENFGGALGGGRANTGGAARLRR